MTMFRLAPPRSGSADDTLTVTLSGAVYQLRFRWNTRGDMWMLDVSTVDGDPIVSGRPIHVDRPILGPSQHPRRPPGELIAGDASGSYTRPGLEDLGKRVHLYYVEPAD